MALISVGIDHEHASLDLLERASVPEHEWSKVLRTPDHPAQRARGRLRLDVPAHRGRRGHRPVPRRDRRDHRTRSPRRPASPRRVRRSPHRELRPRRRDPSLQRRLRASSRSCRASSRCSVSCAARSSSASRSRPPGRRSRNSSSAPSPSGRRVRTETPIARGTTSFAQAAVVMATDELGVDLAGADVSSSRRRPVGGGHRARAARPAGALRRASRCSIERPRARRALARRSGRRARRRRHARGAHDAVATARLVVAARRGAGAGHHAERPRDAVVGTALRRPRPAASHRARRRRGSPTFAALTSVTCASGWARRSAIGARRSSEPSEFVARRRREVPE